MNEVVTLAPWNPWPLLFPVLILIAAVVVSIVGARRKVAPLRETGYIVFIIAALAGGAMLWTMTSIWDSEQRTAALVALGYESPTYGSSASNPSEASSVAFQAERDGERVRGAFVHLGGDQWRVTEISE